jgi:hypothetical protein
MQVNQSKQIGQSMSIPKAKILGDALFRLKYTITKEKMTF